MADLNVVSIVGRLTRDVESRKFGELTASKLSVAVNDRKKKDGKWTDVVSFVSCTLFGSEGLLCYLTKGKQVAISGKLEQNTWEDKTTGQKRSELRVVAQSIQLLGGEGKPSAPKRSSEDEFDPDMPF